MGFLDIFRSKKEPEPVNITDTSINDSLSLLTSSTVDSALRNPIIFSAVKCISEAISSLPINVYKWENGSKVIARDYKYFSLIHDSPNIATVSSVFFQSIVSQLLLVGNNYIKKNKDKTTGNIIDLEILEPEDIKAEIVNNKKKYHYKGKVINGEDIIHVIGLSYDSLTGINVLDYHRDTFNLIQILFLFTQNYFKKGAHLGGYLKATKDNLDEKDIEALKVNWVNAFSGISNTRKTPVLQGFEYKEITNNSAKDAMLIEAISKMQELTASIFGIPVSKLGSLQKTSYSSLEQEQQNFLSALMVWIKRIEQAFNKDFFPPEDKGKYFIEFNVQSFLKANTADTYSAISSGVINGFLTGNEARQLIGLPPLAGLDRPRAQLNTETI